MAIFVDTSGVFAFLDPGDGRHEPAGRFWIEAVNNGELLVTSNYVVLETFSLVQRRLGMAAARAFRDGAVPLLRVEWVDEPLHDRAVHAWLAAGRRQLSLVDCISFEVMRRLGLSRAFAMDAHFSTQGFTCVP